MGKPINLFYPSKIYMQIIPSSVTTVYSYSLHNFLYVCRSSTLKKDLYSRTDVRNKYIICILLLMDYNFATKTIF